VFAKDVKFAEMVAQNALFFYDSYKKHDKNVGKVVKR
jgi:hypothetical protein